MVAGVAKGSGQMARTAGNSSMTGGGGSRSAESIRVTKIGGRPNTSAPGNGEVLPEPNQSRQHGASRSAAHYAEPMRRYGGSR